MSTNKAFEIPYQWDALVKNCPDGFWMFAFEWDEAKSRPRYNALPVYVKYIEHLDQYYTLSKKLPKTHISRYERKGRFAATSRELAVKYYKEIVENAIAEREKYILGSLENDKVYVKNLLEKANKL